MTTFRAGLTKLTALLPQSHDCSYYVHRRILDTSTAIFTEIADLRAFDFTYWGHLPKLVNNTCAWSWTLCGITPSIIMNPAYRGVSYKGSFPDQPLCFLCSGRGWCKTEWGGGAKMFIQTSLHVDPCRHLHKASSNQLSESKARKVLR